MKPPKHRLSFNKLSDTEFEEFTFDLLEELGFVNMDWRKGTGKKTSPADSGRDIVAHLNRTDIDKSRRSERWFVDCKHYVKGVPAKELHNLLAWAEAERPDVALIVASNFLSNPAKDYLEAYQRNNRPPFVIKVWERTNLETMTRGKRDLLQMHGVLKSYVRPESEIGKAEDEYFTRVWYDRHMMFMKRVKEGRDSAPPDIINGAKAAAAKARKKYGTSISKLKTDFEWGFVNGKLSALRWVLGEDWDMLDT
ncbi:MAG TPA: restriction endonuclease [Terracidiphilus sp.]|nr:restriction endonuclease [Terracidiphilus sp.]